MSQELLDSLHATLLEIYDKGTQLKPPYYAADFLQMVHRLGGKETADRLLATGNPSSGFTSLFMRGPKCLEISLEYVVLRHPWRSLFEPEQLAIARKRLLDHNCQPPAEDTSA